MTNAMQKAAIKSWPYRSWHSGIDPEPRKRHVPRMPDFVRRIPDDDNRERLICADCGHIVYDNPKVVAGSVVDPRGTERR